MEYPKLVLAVDHQGLTPESPWNIDLIASLEQLRHNETYKFYEIREEIFTDDIDTEFEKTANLISKGIEHDF